MQHVSIEVYIKIYNTYLVCGFLYMLMTFKLTNSNLFQRAQRAKKHQPDTSTQWGTTPTRHLRCKINDDSSEIRRGEKSHLGICENLLWIIFQSIGFWLILDDFLVGGLEHCERGRASA